MLKMHTFLQKSQHYNNVSFNLSDEISLNASVIRFKSFFFKFGQLYFSLDYCKMLDFFFGEYAVLEVVIVWDKPDIFIIVICIIIFVLSIISLHRICGITFPSH